MNDASRPVSRRTYLGVFLISLATLMHEVVLTRIFSVTMWYHFAFVAVSVGMFGMTVGALLVFLLPRVFTTDRVFTQLAATAALYPILLIFSLLTQLSVPFVVHPSVVGVYSMVFVYAVIALPFVASGVVVSLALTRFTARVSELYAADLVGAALGCLLLVLLLPLTDGPTAVLFVAFLASLAAVVFALDTTHTRLRRLAGLSALLLGVAAAGHTVLVWKQFPVLRILWAKGSFEPRPLYERWNSYSRVRVTGDESVPERPFQRSLSPTFPPDRLVRQLRMDIDVNASTSILGYRGDLSEVDFLKSDVTNIGHYLRPADRVLVVGTGGGRDILAALSFDAKSVTGVELNGQILETLNGRFGEFSGHLDRDPRVRFVNDEARSFVARSNEKYDFIQVSLIDTWAATAAGAFILSENAIYTVDAWQVLLRHLTDGGVLSVSRWDFEQRPDEIYRLVSLAVASLRRVGVDRPQDHLVLIRSRPQGPPGAAIGVGTLLVSRTPILAGDLDRLEAAANRLQFETRLSPRLAGDQVLARLVSGEDLTTFFASYPVKLTAPTDDSPFFFQMLKPSGILDAALLNGGKQAPNLQAVLVLVILLVTVVSLSLLCIFTPLALTADRSVLRNTGPLLLYFAAIGLGFMLIEISQVQRLIVVLGHPTYALSVVLFVLLLASGLGSQLTGRLSGDVAARLGPRLLAVLLALLAVTGLVTPMITHAFEASTTPVRIAIAVALLFPAGLCMGMPFPLGMKIASARDKRLTPWLWGINGALSVCASVLAIAISVGSTISAAFWAGVITYAVALAAFSRGRQAAASPAPVEMAASTR
jgi:hypothetical protein